LSTTRRALSVTSRQTSWSVQAQEVAASAWPDGHDHRAVERVDDLAEPDVPGRAGELVAAAGAAAREDQLAAPERAEELVQVRLRDVLAQRDVATLDRPAALVQRQVEHGADAVVEPGRDL
jgi:hypothetical protein